MIFYRSRYLPMHQNLLFWWQKGTLDVRGKSTHQIVLIIECKKCHRINRIAVSKLLFWLFFKFLDDLFIIIKSQFLRNSERRHAKNARICVVLFNIALVLTVSGAGEFGANLFVKDVLAEFQFLVNFNFLPFNVLHSQISNVFKLFFFRTLWWQVRVYLEPRVAHQLLRRFRRNNGFIIANLLMVLRTHVYKFFLLWLWSFFDCLVEAPSGHAFFVAVWEATLIIRVCTKIHYSPFSFPFLSELAWELLMF